MRQALGKGLDALIPSSLPGAPAPEAPAKPSQVVPVEKIRPNRLQPRKEFHDASIAELAQSIKEHGLTQPLVVTRDANGDYELIAGERRLRASKLAGIKEVPVFIKENLNNQQRLVLALIENLQREDLNAIEAAQSYRKLMLDFSFTQERVAQAMSKSRSAVANTMRLLELPEEIQGEILSGRLSEGHGRALLMVADPVERKLLCEKTLALKLSVRDLEDAAKARRLKKDRPVKTPVPVELKNLESELQLHFGTKVKVRCSKKGVGSLSLEFYSMEDLERLYHLIKK